MDRVGGWIRHNTPAFIGVMGGALCAVLIRLLFANIIADSSGTLTIGLLFVGPFALGFASIALGTAEDRTSISRRFLIPIATCVVALVICVISSIEVGYWLILGFPLYILMAIIGGHMAAFILNTRIVGSNGEAPGAE